MGGKVPAIYGPSADEKPSQVARGRPAREITRRMRVPRLTPTRFSNQTPAYAGAPGS